MEERDPQSFGKSLYFGYIPEPLVVPYPTLRPEELENLKLILDQFHKFAHAQIDSKKIDEEGKLPPAVLDGMKALGLFGLAIPEEHGGLGLSVTAYARAMQEFSFQVFEAFTAATIIYIVINIIVTFAMRYVEQRVAVPGLIGAKPAVSTH